MSLFNKKRGEEQSEPSSESPELPALPEFPQLPRFSQPYESSSGYYASNFSDLPELPEKARPLPSFPGEFGEDFSQEAVKSAVASIDNNPKEKRTVEIAEWQESKTPILRPVAPHEISTEPAFASIPVHPRKFLPVRAPIVKTTKKIEPVYIRIDKFKSAIQSFQEIHLRVQEIESLLKDVRELKNKEDQELRRWEEEIETIKARIEAIDLNIFSKLD